MPEIPAMTPAAIRRALWTRTEIAILDVRPEGRFAGGHPLFAASFPHGFTVLSPQRKFTAS